MNPELPDDRPDLRSLATTLVLERARLGDAEAQRVLVERVLPRIASRVRKERRNPVLKRALETMYVANDVAMELVKSLPRLKASNSRTLEAYLAVVVRHTLCDEYRKILAARARFGRMQSLSSDSEFELDAPSASVSEIVSREEVLARARAILPLLGPRDEYLVRRRRFEDHEIRDIARDVGDKEDNVRNAEVRAYARYLSLIRLSEQGRLAVEIEKIERDLDSEAASDDDVSDAAES